MARRRVVLVNDFVGTGYGLLTLRPSEYRTVHGPTAGAPGECFESPTSLSLRDLALFSLGDAPSLPLRDASFHFVS